MQTKNRVQVSDEIILHTRRKLATELDRRLAKKGRGAYLSKHEALGVITEEFYELVDAVRNDENPSQFLEECMDVAVAAIFTLASYEAHYDPLSDRR